ncbi:phosphate signaling complex protein PhoU [Victivallis sp. Marseille-Q1083]|uniref:phosphate signaling complex protein PhoU n=1 Tax=Victivallis sp. Marseille-Q1083 TaxID=2717288 RepID=UPI00158B9BF0|nr:phosphate signaling complex protein PhoU [Victivallis sp. Marseille-Q1083]
MRAHFYNEITMLRNMIAAQAAAVEEVVRQSVEAISRGDAKLAADLIAGDRLIDLEEINIEEECLKILALHQPVAGDLRYVITFLKVNSELERIGDLAVNIAERTVDIVTSNPGTEIAADIDFLPMCNEARSMLTLALNALIDRNTAEALKVIRHDDVVDDQFKKSFERLRQLIAAHPVATDYYLNLLSVFRNLERMADCATNIGEDVIYLESGKIVRHENLSEVK